jgi:hypothetical protein
MPHEPNPTLEKIHNNLSSAFENAVGDVSVGRVRVQATPTRSCYVSAAAVQGIADFGSKRAFLNPQVIIDVRFQRDRFPLIHLIPSLMNYVLISQRKMRVSQYVRKNSSQWTLTDYSDPDNVIVLSPLGVSLPLAAIYQEIDFDIPPETPMP